MQTIKDMRRFFLTFTLALFAVAASAGEKATKPSCAGFVSNRFLDNWEISAGFGINTAISNGDDFGKKAGFEGHIAATKWFHPIAGLRLQFEGGRFGNVDPEMGTMKWPYLYTHTDLTINASNWIGGYRDDRVYTAVPFVGFGYMVANFTDSFQQKFDAHTSHNYAFTYGLQNRFRISPSVNFDLEIKGLLLPSRICPAEMGGSYMFGFSATAGFTYRFNQRGWQRGVAGYTAEDIRAFQDAVAAGNAALEDAKAANDQLTRNLASAQAEADAAKAEARAAKAASGKVIYETGTSVIFFRYGVSKLTDREKVRLDLIADMINKAPKDKVFTIEGHADPETGSAAGNERVAANRAKNVYQYLVSKGVKPARLTYQGMGTKANPFKTSETNRVVVIR